MCNKKSSTMLDEYIVHAGDFYVRSNVEPLNVIYLALELMHIYNEHGGQEDMAEIKWY